jgi:ankyrin repeat protein
MMTQNDFYWAMATGDLDRVRAGLESGKTIDVRSSDGVEALFFAVEISNLAVLRLLLEAGAPANRGDSRGRTVIHAAARWNRVEVLEALTPLNLHINSAAENPPGSTPLHEAALHGALESAQWLVSNGAEIHARLETGETPADLARMRGNLEIVRILEGGLSAGDYLFRGWSHQELAYR